MRVYVDGDVFAWQRAGGISRIYREMLPRLVRMAPEVQLTISVRRSIGPDVMRDLAQWCQCIPSLPLNLRPWRFWRRMSPIVNDWLAHCYWKTRKADVFLSTYYTSPPIRAPRICVVYDLIVEQFGSFFETAWVRSELKRKEYAIRRADMNISISENTANDLRRIHGVDVVRSTVIRLAGFSKEMVDAIPKQNSKQDSRLLLFVGDYRSRYKNFEFMLKAISCDARFGGYHVVVVSSSIPSEAEIHRYSQQAGGLILRFENRCDDVRLMSLYSSCSAVVYPSLYEGFGIPILEALACGAPTVCSETSSMPEVGGAVAYYFDPRSESSLCLALASAIAEGREPERVAMRKRHAATFSWDRTAMEFLQVMKDLHALYR